MQENLSINNWRIIMENLFSRSTGKSAVKFSGLLLLGFVLFFCHIKNSSAVTILRYCSPATNISFQTEGNGIGVSASNIVRYISGNPSIYFRHIVAYRISGHSSWDYKTVGYITRLNDANSWWSDPHIRDLRPNTQYEAQLINRCSSNKIPTGGHDIGGSVQSVSGIFNVSTGPAPNDPTGPTPNDPTGPGPCNKTPAGITLQHTKPAGGKSIVHWGDGSAEGWQLGYRQVGTGRWIGGIHNLTWKAFTVSGLQPKIFYEVFIRPTCGPGRPGKWGARHLIRFLK
jgi:hypothetical protein